MNPVCGGWPNKSSITNVTQAPAWADTAQNVWRATARARDVPRLNPSRWPGVYGVPE